MPRSIVRARTAASTPPAAPRQCPTIDLIEVTGSATDWVGAMERVWSHPDVLPRLKLNRGEIGSAEEICDQLVERRERWGISYIGLSADQLDAFEPVVARLAGT